MSDCVKCKYEVLVTDLGYNWDTIYGGIWNYKSGHGGYENFKMDLSNGATVEVHSKSDQADYDEYEGRTQDMWVALKVTEPNGQVLFFRKNGSADSYANVTWNGLFQQVKAVEKKVIVFEPSFEVV